MSLVSDTTVQLSNVHPATLGELAVGQIEINVIIPVLVGLRRACHRSFC